MAGRFSRGTESSLTLGFDGPEFFVGIAGNPSFEPTVSSHSQSFTMRSVVADKIGPRFSTSDLILPFGGIAGVVEDGKHDDPTGSDAVED